MKTSLVGMGMGDGETLTMQAQKALNDADIVLGAPRLLENIPKRDGVQYLPLALPTEMAQEIQKHPEWHKLCVVLSGDVGFYSGAAKLSELLPGFDVESICGVSSPQQLAAKLGRPWQGWKLVSGHGKNCDVLAEVLNHPAVFFLTGGGTTPAEICRQLVVAGLGDAMVAVGENLCAPDEHIVAGMAQELDGLAFAPLAVALVESQKGFARATVSPGIADETFIRDKTPMTKREVRVNILALLDIRPDDVLFDIGAGTGSVAVEMALLARRGRVHAVERDADACELIRQNKEKFGAYNLNIVHGMAPEALEGLPMPHAAFVGGSKGNMRAILEWLHKKNPDIRVVASAVTLETLSESLSAMQALEMRRIEVTQIAVCHAVETGSLHMLRAQNPVFLISGGERRDD